MNPFTHKIQEEPTKPLDEQEAIEETKDAEVIPQADKEPESRADFNCSNCGGSGLIWHEGAKRHELCPACFGKGKLN